MQIPASLDRWLAVLAERGGTDLLLTSNSAPRARVHGDLAPLENEDSLSAGDVEAIASSLLSPEQLEALDEAGDVDFSFTWRDKARLRGSFFTQRGHRALALRMIPGTVPELDSLGMPPVSEWIASQTRGFILVTGPTGSGKSTTLAAIVNRINETRAAHILTLEDPVEYVHTNKMGVVNQREIGVDSPSFARALRSALREDPDVVLVGEMRDPESIQIALTLAETGHLVLATLHTNDAPQAVDRIIDVFPAGQQEQVRVQLAASLNTVIAQRLLPKEGGGMVAAYEVLVATAPVRNLIREGRSNQIANVMMTSAGDGMQTMETHLAQLVREGVVTFENAQAVSGRTKELTRLVEQVASKGSRS